MPFITGSYAVTGAATTPTPFQTIERKDVGLTLRVKPQISEGGTVRLQIYQEVSSVVDTILPNPAGVTTNKRAVESTVLVDDGQIVVIGGLIQDSVKDGVEKVPLLGDIPLLGALFTYKHALAQQDQPDGVPAPDGAARRAARGVAHRASATTTSSASSTRPQPPRQRRRCPTWNRPAAAARPPP